MKGFTHSKAILFAALLTLGAGAFFSSCQKDDQAPSPISDPPQETEPCEPIPFWTGLGLRPTIGDSLDILFTSRPLVNPRNPDEIIFQLSLDRKVYKVNFTTLEKQILLEEGQHYRSLDWGTNDWLLYTQNGLHKVKSNGDSLTQITNGLGSFASWNPDGDKYTYVKTSSQGGLMRVIANTHDEIIDTLPVTLNLQVDWATEDTIFFRGGMYIMGQDQATPLYEIPMGQTGYVSAISNSEFAHLASGLRIVNAQTGVVVQTHPPYPACRSYLGIHYSPQKQKLLSTEMYRELMPDGIHEYLKFSMVWLNLDGTVHETIDITPFFSE